MEAGFTFHEAILTFQIPNPAPHAHLTKNLPNFFTFQTSIT
jgi:hypothetical protein